MDTSPATATAVQFHNAEAMRGVDRKRNPNQKSLNGRRIVGIACCRETSESRNGVAFQMNFLFFSSFRSRVRASKTSIARFHDLPFGCSVSKVVSSQEVIQNPDAWFVKILCTLCVRYPSLEAGSNYFAKSLNPSIAFEVIKRLNNPKLALKFFEFSRASLKINHSVRTYNLLVKSLCQIGLHDLAIVVVDYMRSDGHFPDGAVLGFLVSSCAHAGKFDVAKGLLSQVHGDGIRMNLLVYNNLLNLLVKQNQVEEAVCFFREHLSSYSHPDTCTFNIVIRGLCRIGQIDTAFEFFHDMGSFGCSPDIITYNTLINGLCRAGEVDRGHELLKEIQLKYEFKPDVVTYTSVISSYCKLGKIEEASILLKEMVSFGITPNRFTYNVLIDGFGKAGDMVSAMTVYEKMLLQGCLPDVVTFASLMDGYCRNGQVDQGMKLWHGMRERNLLPNAYIFSILINALCKENRLSEAREFLRQLKWSDIVPQPFMYNPVIDGFCKAGNVEEANIIVSEMKEKRCNPDKLTFTILIIGHCMKGKMLEAINIFNKMITGGCAPDSITISSLVSCLLKAGMPNEANQILLTVSDKQLDLGLSSFRRNSLLHRSTDIPVAV